MNVSEEFDKLHLLRKKGLIPYYGFFSSSVRLLFLRKLRGKPSEGSTEDYRAMIKNRSFDRGALKAALLEEEKASSLEANSLASSLPYLASLLSKRNEVWNYLDSDLPEAKEGEMESLLEELLKYADKDYSKGMSFASRSELLSPLREALDVKESESFLDVFAGFYTLGYGIKAKEYHGFDKDEGALGVARMALLLLGKENIGLKKAEVYSLKELPSSDKIFLDVFSARSNEGRKIEKLIHLCLASLNKGGKAVVLCNSKLLSGEEFRDFRKLLVSSGRLSSVTALPSPSFSKRYLLTLSEQPGEKTIFLNTSSLEREDVLVPHEINCGPKGKPHPSLSEEERLPESGAGKKEEVSNQTILKERNVSLLPSIHCKALLSGKKKSCRALEEIEKDLEEEYKRFMELCK